MTDFLPETEEAAASIIREHAAAGKPLAICGGNTRSGFGNPVAKDRLRSTGLSGIVSMWSIPSGASASLTAATALVTPLPR